MNILDDLFNPEENGFTNNVFLKRLVIFSYANRVAALTSFLLGVYILILSIDSYNYLPTFSLYLVFVMSFLTSSFFLFKSANKTLAFAEENTNLELLDNGLKYFIYFWITFTLILILFLYSEFVN